MDETQNDSQVQIKQSEFQKLTDLEKAVWAKLGQFDEINVDDYYNDGLSTSVLNPSSDAIKTAPQNSIDCNQQYINFKPLIQDSQDLSGFESYLNDVSEYSQVNDRSDISITAKEAIFQIQRDWLAKQAQDKNLQSITPQSSQYYNDSSYISQNYTPQRKPSIFDFQETISFCNESELDWGSAIKYSNFFTTIDEDQHKTLNNIITEMQTEPEGASPQFTTQNTINGVSPILQRQKPEQISPFLSRKDTGFQISPIISRQESEDFNFFTRQNTECRNLGLESPRFTLQKRTSLENNFESPFLDKKRLDIMMQQFPKEYSTSADEAKTTPRYNNTTTMSDFSIPNIPNERSEIYQTIEIVEDADEDNCSVASEGEQSIKQVRKLIDQGASGGKLANLENYQ